MRRRVLLLAYAVIWAVVSAVVKRHPTELTYDPDVDMAYVHVTEIGAGESDAQVVIHDQRLPSEIVIDLDHYGRILGFELFDGSECLPLKLLDELR